MAETLGISQLSEKIIEILKSNGILNKVKLVNLDDSGLRGQNYASLTEYITVTFEDDTKPLHLFVKNKLLESSAHGKVIEDIQFFKKESLFFNSYLPEARDICQLRGVSDLMDIYPKCYYADESVLIFENLVVDKGYSLLQFGDQDLEAAKLGVINIAKHHAISHAVIEKHGGAEKFIKAYPIFTFDPWFNNGLRDSMGPLIEGSLETTIAILEKSRMDGAKEGIKRLRNMQGHTWDEMKESFTMEEGDFKLLIHGDYHNNNMLFKKDDEGNVSEQIPVDFQQVRLNTVGVDLGLYLMGSIKPEVRKEHLEELLEIYLNTLNQTASKLEHPIGMGMNVLRKYFQRSFKKGFWLSYGWSNGGARVDFERADLDVREMNSFEEIGVMMKKSVVEMMENDQEICEENAKNILKRLDEYDDFVNGSF